jgi:hypothetical protein
MEAVACLEQHPMAKSQAKHSIISLTINQTSHLLSSLSGNNEGSLIGAVTTCVHVQRGSVQCRPGLQLEVQLAGSI